MNEISFVYQESAHHARKEYKCYECSGVIRKKELYCKCFGIWNNIGKKSYKLCVDCHNLMNEINNTIKYNDEGVYFGGLSEYVIESKNNEWINNFREINQKRNGIYNKIKNYVPRTTHNII